MLTLFFCLVADISTFPHKQLSERSPIKVAHVFTIAAVLFL
jgi:hypothetical protein